MPAQSAAAPDAAPPAMPVITPMNGPQAIEVLDQTIDWYRTLGIQQQAAVEPSDLLILYDNRQIANQVIGLAYELARANAEILAKLPAAKDEDAASQSLSRLQSKFAFQGAAVQVELEADQARLAKSRPEQTAALQSKISELQGEIELIDARKSLLATLSAFSNQSDATGFSAGALKAQIDAMALTTPAAPT